MSIGQGASSQRMSLIFSEKNLQNASGSSHKRGGSHSKGYVQRFCKLRLAQKYARLEQSKAQKQKLDKNKVPPNILVRTLIQVHHVQDTRQSKHLCRTGEPWWCNDRDGTGASLTVISEEILASVKKGVRFPLRKSTKNLKTYTEEEIPVLGLCTVSIPHKNSQPKKLDTVVLKWKGPCLLGRDWLKEIQLDWLDIVLLNTSTIKDIETTQIPSELSEVFQDIRGNAKGTKATIYVRRSAKSLID